MLTYKDTAILKIAFKALSAKTNYMYLKNNRPVFLWGEAYESNLEAAKLAYEDSKDTFLLACLAYGADCERFWDLAKFCRRHRLAVDNFALAKGAAEND